jgi:tetratricopeptide (TPR) repeat protein
MNSSDTFLCSTTVVTDHNADSCADACLNDAHYQLAREALCRRDYTTAAGAAVASTMRHSHHPEAHYLAGLAYLQLGLIDEAEESLLEAVRQRPIYPDAHLKLAYIYRKHRLDFFRLGEHQLLAAKAERAMRACAV